MPTLKLTKRNVDSLKPAAKRFNAWDTDLSGFGLRVTPSGERVYVVKFRVAGAQRWFTIGRHGSPWTPESAHKEAKRLLGEVARGLDPAEKRNADRGAITFAQLCDLYLSEGVAHKKASTLRVDRGRVELHLKPLIGGKRAEAITRADIEKLLSDVKRGRTAAQKPRKRPSGSLAKGGAGVAAQCVALASTVMQFAVDRGIRPDNPGRGIKKPPVRKMQRFLSEAELMRLGEALDQEERATGNPLVVGAIKMLALSGMRRGEVENLRWRDVDFGRGILSLADSKTREKTIYLSPPALALLSALPRFADNDHVFAGTRAGQRTGALDKVWGRVRKSADLPGVRLHDLRHGFASVGAAGGLNLPVVGALLGHRHASTTARYAHLSADPLRAANDSIGATIAASMARGKGADVVVFKR
jgi:integrase